MVLSNLDQIHMHGTSIIIYSPLVTIGSHLLPFNIQWKTFPKVIPVVLSNLDQIYMHGTLITIDSPLVTIGFHLLPFTI